MRKQNVTFKYLPSVEHDLDWGLAVSCVGFQQVKPGDAYPPQSHPANYNFQPGQGRVLNECQLVYIANGRGEFHSDHGGSINIQAGDVILLFPGERHYYHPDKRCGWDEYWIGFRGPNIDRRIHHGFFSTEHPVFHVGISDDIQQLYTSAINAAQHMGQGYQQLLAGCVNMLLGYIYTLDGRNNAESEENTKAMQQAIIYIHDNYQRDIHPEDVARVVNYGYSRFRKAFQNYTGQSPYQHILQLRIQRSKELLEHTSKTLSEIAYEVGFNNPLYFSTAFKRDMKMSPKQYRKATSQNTKS